MMSDSQIVERLAEITGYELNGSLIKYKGEFINPFDDTPPAKAFCFDLCHKHQIEIRYSYKQVGFWKDNNGWGKVFNGIEIGNDLSMAIYTAVIQKVK